MSQQLLEKIVNTNVAENEIKKNNCRKMVKKDISVPEH